MLVTQGYHTVQVGESGCQQTMQIGGAQELRRRSKAGKLAKSVEVLLHTQVIHFLEDLWPTQEEEQGVVP